MASPWVPLLYTKLPAISITWFLVLSVFAGGVSYCLMADITLRQAREGEEPIKVAMELAPPQ